jgi:hypothetical protein
MANGRGPMSAVASITQTEDMIARPLPAEAVAADRELLAPILQGGSIAWPKASPVRTVSKGMKRLSSSAL